MKDYTYTLAQYHGRNSRMKCPSCGREHCFTPYVDANGDILHESVGRCDHESSCGYHYPPRKYFRDKREFKYKIPPNRITESKTSKGINTIDITYVKNSVRTDIDSTFTSFLRKIMTPEQVDKVINEYQLGVTHTGDVIFFELDITGRCRTGKIMKYDSSGHRIKDPNIPSRIDWVHSNLKRSGKLPQEWISTQCLFGEHLLNRYPGKTVGLVEAEKTAVICSAFFPDYVWLAIGGKSHLNDRLNVLQGRHVIAFPDCDGVEVWNRKALKFPNLDITVSDIILSASTESSCNKADLADWLIAWQSNHTNNKTD